MDGPFPHHSFPPHVEISQLISTVNQWAGFYMRRTFAWKKLIKYTPPLLIVITIMVATISIFNNIYQFYLQYKDFFSR